jgi:cytochrome c-type biogenesis protein CcmF
LEFSDLIIRVFNYLILALVLLFFIGQTYPLTSELISGGQITWNAQMYELYSSPLLFLLMIITAICPLSNLYEKQRKKFWRKFIFFIAISLTITLLLIIIKGISLIESVGFLTVFFLIITWADSLLSRSFNLRSNNRYDSRSKGRLSGFGSIFIHVGLGLMALGIMGQETLSDTFELNISEGETLSVGGFQINLQDSSQIFSPEGTTFSVVNFSIIENGQKNFTLTPDLEYYPKMQMQYARPAISSNLKRDIQIILYNWKDENTGKFGVHITINPLLIWIWIGGLLMSLGGVFTLVQQWLVKRKN